MLGTRRLGNTFNNPIRLFMFPDFGSGSSQVPEWGTFTFANGQVGVAYTGSWDMPLSDQPITYTLLSGTLPTGLSIASSNGHSGSLSGTPTVAGSYTFTLRAQSLFGRDDQSFTIVIAPAAVAAATVMV